MKNFILLLLCVALLTFTIPVFASFPDVEGNPSISWAKEHINDMANLGYIKGYEDGTFRPYQSVSKIEALILLARVLGVDEAVNIDRSEYALTLFTTDLRPYSIPYKKEAAFLLYNDVLSVAELPTYISDATKDTALQRYEAAILLTKLMGGEKEVKELPMVVSSFKDAAQIPAVSKGYVEYVKDHGVMQGMGVDPATNTPIFEPLTEVTRAQMATMLANLLTVLDREYQSGSLVSVDSIENTITVTSNGVNHIAQLQDNSVVRIDGLESTVNKLSAGNSVTITYIYGIPRIIDARTTSSDAQFEGIMSGSETSAEGIKITVQNIDNSSQKTFYVLSSDCTYTLNDNNTFFGDIQIGDYVSGHVANGKVVQLSGYSKSATVEGTIANVSAEDNVSLTVRLNSGIAKTFTTSPNKKVTVTKNNSVSDLRALTIGDTVTVNLEYNRIVRVTAVSSKSKMEGTIEEIVISKEPIIKIKINDTVTTYYISSDVKITMDGTTDATIRDLYLGARIKFETESQSIVSIETTSVLSIDKVEGVVSSVEASFRFMKVAVKDNVSGEVTYQEILVDKNASITQVGSSTKRSMEDIKVGQTVLAYGSNVTGNFRADTVLIIQQP